MIDLEEVVLTPEQEREARALGNCVTDMFLARKGINKRRPFEERIGDYRIIFGIIEKNPSLLNGYSSQSFFETAEAICGGGKFSKSRALKIGEIVSAYWHKYPFLK